MDAVASRGLARRVVPDGRFPVPDGICDAVPTYSVGCPSRILTTPPSARTER
jgi:hypothetical protein